MLSRMVILGLWQITESFLQSIELKNWDKEAFDIFHSRYLQRFDIFLKLVTHSESHISTNNRFSVCCKVVQLLSVIAEGKI